MDSPSRIPKRAPSAQHHAIQHAHPTREKATHTGHVLPRYAKQKDEAARTASHSKSQTSGGQCRPAPPQRQANYIAISTSGKGDASTETVQGSADSPGYHLYPICRATTASRLLLRATASALQSAPGVRHSPVVAGLMATAPALWSALRVGSRGPWLRLHTRVSSNAFRPAS